MTSISIPEINEKVRGYFQECLNKGEEYVLLFPQDPTINVLDEATDLGQRIEQMQRDLAYACFPQDVRDMASCILTAEPGKVQNDASDEYQYACRTIMRAKIESARVLTAKLSGDYTSVAPKDILFDGMVSTGLPPLPGEKGEPVHAMLNFGEVVGLYLTQKSPSWAAKTIQAVTYALKVASELYGSNKPMSLYGTSDKKLLRDTLAKLPPQQSKASKFANQAALSAAAANVSGPYLSATTQKKNLDFLGAFLNWANNEDYIEKVPGGSVKVIAEKKQAPTPKREAYSPADLKKVFDTPVFVGCQSASRRMQQGIMVIKDGYYWIPLIALFTGMRLGEIVQLRGVDVKCVDGVRFFHVQMDEEQKNQIKTGSSYRKVPIHSQLFALGLQQVLDKAEPNGRLFPEIKPGIDGYMSHNFSKWWGGYSIKAGFARAKTSFHSFRHSFKDALINAKVSEVVAKALMGHSDSSVHGGYGSGPTLVMMAEEIEKITFPIAHAAMKNS